MAYIPVDNVVQLELVYQLNGETAENVLHYKPDVTVTAALMTELCVDMVTWYNTLLKPYVSVQMALANVRATDMTTQTGPVVDYGTGLPAFGGQTGDPLPNNCAIVFTKRTALRGRSYRGRIYHMGIPESQSSGNFIGGALLIALQSAYLAVINRSTTGASWELGVVSRRQDGVDLIAGIFTPMTTFTSDGRFDSQRRRLP